VVRVLLTALADLRHRCPQIAGRLRLHFFGTSNERSATQADRVRPIAVELGVGDLVAEHAARVDYLTAVRIQTDAHALLLLGSSEPHYTASRLYPALAARRPLLALYHDASSVVEICGATRGRQLSGSSASPTSKRSMLNCRRLRAPFRQSASARSTGRPTSTIG